LTSRPSSPRLNPVLAKSFSSTSSLKGRIRPKATWTCTLGRLPSKTPFGRTLHLPNLWELSCKQEKEEPRSPRPNGEGFCSFQTQLTQLYTFTHRDQLAANATPTSPTPTQTFPSANADATGNFFWYFPPPSQNLGGRGGVGARSAPGETR
jgi:hypothetical protein